MNKILSLYFVALGMAFLVNPTYLRNIYPQITKDKNFLFFGGILAVLIGAVIVSIHNIWTFNWSTIITVLGWWSLLKGFVLLIRPDSIKWFSFILNRSDSFYRTISLVYLFLGFFLLYKGVGWG